MTSFLQDCTFCLRRLVTPTQTELSTMALSTSVGFLVLGSLAFSVKCLAAPIRDALLSM